MWKRVQHKYGEMEIDMSIYMDGISVAGGPEGLKKGIKKCATMKVKKKRNIT